MSEKRTQDDMIFVTPEIEAALGRSAAAIKQISLRELAEAAFEKGFVWNVRADGGFIKGLTIKVEDTALTPPAPVDGTK